MGILGKVKSDNDLEKRVSLPASDNEKENAGEPQTDDEGSEGAPPEKPKAGVRGSEDIGSGYVAPKDLLPGEYYRDDDRPRWASRYHCLLATVGFVVGLSNLYRFPALCFRHGGPAFLMVYGFLLIACGFPLVYLETLIGQFSQSGMILTWKKLVPMMRGVGWCMCLLPLITAFHNTTFLTWALFYVFNGFVNSKLPWIGCEHEWNTPNCRDIPADFEQVDVQPGEIRAGAEFFRGRVQRRWNSKFAKDNMTNSIPGSITYGLRPMDVNLGVTPAAEMVITNTVVYILLYILFHGGIRFRGNGVIFSVCAPYVVMLILIFRAISIPGAASGLVYLFVPTTENMKHVLHPETWAAAANQMFFSLSAGAGVILTFSSYSTFQSPTPFWNAVGLLILDTSVSMLGSIITFLAVGSLAFSDGDKIGNIFAQGPDLIFEVDADFWGRIAGGDFFSFAFFLMVFFYGFECTLESLVCAKEGLFEAYGKWFDDNGRTRWIFVNVLIVTSYLFGLFSLSRGGLHLFLTLDVYSGGIPFLTCGLLLSISFAWLWGLQNICDAAEAMTGRRPSWYFQICWKYICPPVLTVILIVDLSVGTVATYRDPYAVDKKNTEVAFNKDVQIFGLVFGLIPNLFIVWGIIYHFYSTEGVSFKKRLLIGISPNYEHQSIKDTGTNVRTTMAHYISRKDVDCFCKKKKANTEKVHPTASQEQQSHDEDTKSEAGVASGVTFQLSSQTDMPVPEEDKDKDKDKADKKSAI